MRMYRLEQTPTRVTEIKRLSAFEENAENNNHF